MDEKTRTAAGIAAGLQGMKYDDKRLAEIAAEVEMLNDAVRKAAARASPSTTIRRLSPASWSARRANEERGSRAVRI